MSISAKQALQSLRLRPQDLPSRILSDAYMYTTRLGDDDIRITSIGEFSEWDTQPTPSVDTNFRREAKRQFPQLSPLIDTATTYCGHRPYVADGLVLLGAVDDVERFYVSCGPGSNGWKLATGSGELIARMISGESNEDIQHELGFDPRAFAPSASSGKGGRVLYTPWFARLCRARWNV
jgi:glycine/D-amino acid oxidase-like deaminating enzyme